MSETEAMAKSEWLKGLDDREKLRAIMAAVRRCHAECSEPRLEPTGPHISGAMAEIFIAQIMETTGERIRASERARISKLAEDVDAFYDAPCPDGDPDCIHQDTPFANLLRETP